MNTIPLIFNERQIKRTVIGGSDFTCPADECLPISVILLNRGARHYRTQIFQHLLGFKFRSVVSVEQSGENYELENLARRYPFVKFLIPLESVTTGDMINMAMSELDAEYVLVIWNDVTIPTHTLPTRLVEKITSDAILCQLPVLSNTQLQPLPVERVPTNENSKFKIHYFSCYKDGTPSFYPFDFMGIYHRQKFMQLGGFDYTIVNPYWQNIDFFFRSWLWGEKTRLASLFKINYLEAVTEEDITPDESYLRFFLKNITPVFKMDHAELPRNRFFSYFRRCPHSLFECRAEFNDAREWVEKNKYRFKNDAKLLIETWGSEQ